MQIALRAWRRQRDNDCDVQTSHLCFVCLCAVVRLTMGSGFYAVVFIVVSHTFVCVAPLIYFVSSVTVPRGQFIDTARKRAHQRAATFRNVPVLCSICAGRTVSALLRPSVNESQMPRIVAFCCDVCARHAKRARAATGVYFVYRANNIIAFLAWQQQQRHGCCSTLWHRLERRVVMPLIYRVWH